MMKSTRKMTKSILAMPMDAAEMPPKPKSAATIATMKNIMAQYSMCLLLSTLYIFTYKDSKLWRQAGSGFFHCFSAAFRLRKTVTGTE
jgi:hypothetical protein